MFIVPFFGAPRCSPSLPNSSFPSFLPSRVLYIFISIFIWVPTSLHSLLPTPPFYSATESSIPRTLCPSALLLLKLFPYCSSAWKYSLPWKANLSSRQIPPSLPGQSHQTRSAALNLSKLPLHMQGAFRVICIVCSDQRSLMYDLWHLYILPRQFIHFMAHLQWPFFPWMGDEIFLAVASLSHSTCSQLACPVPQTHPPH